MNGWVLKQLWNSEETRAKTLINLSSNYNNNKL
jgi:hypothetical protein